MSQSSLVQLVPTTTISTADTTTATTTIASPQQQQPPVSSSSSSSAGKAAKFSEVIILYGKGKSKKPPNKQQIADGLKISASSIKDTMFLSGGEMTLITIINQDDYDAILARPPLPVIIGAATYDVLYGPVVHVIWDFRTTADRSNEMLAKALRDFRADLTKHLKDTKITINKESLKEINDIIAAHFRDSVAPLFEDTMNATFQRFSQVFNEGLRTTLRTYIEALKKLDERYVATRERVYTEQTEQIKALQAQVSELSTLVRDQNELIKRCGSNSGSPAAAARSRTYVQQQQQSPLSPLMSGAPSVIVAPSADQVNEAFRAVLSRRDPAVLLAECAKYDPRTVCSILTPKNWVCTVQQLGTVQRGALDVRTGLDLRLAWLLELTSGAVPMEPVVVEVYMTRVVPTVEQSLFGLFESCQDQSLKKAIFQILANLKMADKKAN